MAEVGMLLFFLLLNLPAAEDFCSLGVELSSEFTCWCYGRLQQLASNWHKSLRSSLWCLRTCRRNPCQLPMHDIVMLNNLVCVRVERGVIFIEMKTCFFWDDKKHIRNKLLQKPFEFCGLGENRITWFSLGLAPAVGGKVIYLSPEKQ